MHIDLKVAIEKRENFDVTTNRETISVQNIDFFDVAIDKISEKVINDSIINFDDVKNDNENETIIDRNDKTNEINDIDFEICKKNETINC